MASLRRLIAGSFLFCMLTSASAVWAHHASANFDQSQQYVFKGTVQKFLWSNPHAWVYLDVVKANGKTELWGFELQGGTNALRRGGWKPTDLKPGDKVTIQAGIDRTGKRMGHMDHVVTADGRTLSPQPVGVVRPEGFTAQKKVAAVEYK